MRKMYHICLSSHDEVMYRSEADLIMGFNCLAAAVLATDARLLAEGFLTTHHHLLSLTDSKDELVKYSRSGRLGERRCFCIEVDGLYHTQAALNYVIRQGLHHGLAATPFGYRHCSANAYFRSDLGKTVIPELLSEKSRYKYLPSNIVIPPNYRMSADGLLLREDVIDVSYVEQVYISPRNFLYHMNRHWLEEDIDNQRSENRSPPVTIESIEEGVQEFSSQEAKIYAQGKVNRSHMTDLELCSYIDKVVLPRYIGSGVPVSIYSLSESGRADIGNIIWKESRKLKGRYFTEAQLRRCLCLIP